MPKPEFDYFLNDMSDATIDRVIADREASGLWDPGRRYRQVSMNQLIDEMTDLGFLSCTNAADGQKVSRFERLMAGMNSATTSPDMNVREWQTWESVSFVPDRIMGEVGREFCRNQAELLLRQWQGEFAFPIIERFAQDEVLDQVSIEQALERNEKYRQRELNSDYGSEATKERRAREFAIHAEAIANSRFSITAQQLLDFVGQDLGLPGDWDQNDIAAEDDFRTFVWRARHGVLNELDNRGAFCDESSPFDYSYTSEDKPPLQEILLCEADVAAIVGRSYAEAYSRTEEGRTILKTAEDDFLDLLFYTEGDKHRIQAKFPPASDREHDQTSFL